SGGSRSVDRGRRTRVASALLASPAEFASQGQPGARTPREAAPHAPLSGYPTRRGGGREAQGEPSDRVRPKRGPASSGLHLVAQTIEGPASAQGVTHERGESESVRERATQARARAELVDVGAIAIVPAPEMQLQRAAPSLRPERRREDE